MTHPIQLIALDLDGTLLNSRKELSARNRRALEDAAARGIHIVPCTGRLFDAMPEVVRSLPFVRYAICVNGAQVIDCRTRQTLFRAEIPFARGMELFSALDRLPGIYDCYLDGQGWMSRAMYDRFADFVSSGRTLAFLRSIRTPVEDFMGFVRAQARDFQKIQIFFHSTPERLHYQSQLAPQFPELLMTSSGTCNIEINASNASKGVAVAALCRLLGFSEENALCFGDGSNDVSMLRSAGLGVAMANAEEAIVLEAADLVAPPCDEDGVAQIIEQYVLSR